MSRLLYINTEDITFAFSKIRLYPGMDGLVLTSRLVSREATPACPIPSA
jgi:hypothetical protein